MAKVEDSCWKTRLTRGEGFHPLVDYIVLAEFDIDTGSTVRHQYPNNIPDYKVDWFAEFMLPEGAHNRDVDFTFIFLNRDSPHVDQTLWSNYAKYRAPVYAAGSEGEVPKNLLYGINLVKTRHDSSVRRGAIVKAMCLFSQYHFVEILKKPLELALEMYFDNPSVDVLASLYKSLNAVDLSHLPRPNLLEQSLMRRGVVFETITDQSCQDHLPSGWYSPIQCTFEGMDVPLRVPLFRTPDEVGEIYITLLVKTFGEQVMRIFHAILTKQRVLFVGYNHAASEVAQMVLSAVAMVAPPMTNVIRRTFPYSNLSDLSFLEVAGYVAGVTNPMFQQHDSWWDLLCILDLPNGTGHIYSAEERRKEQEGSKSGAGRMTPPPNAAKSKNNQVLSYEDMPHYQVDNRFVKGVISGINALIGEEWVRQQFTDHSSSILHLALDQDQNIIQNPHKLSDKVRKFADANAARVKLIRQSAEFAEVPPHPWVWCTESDFGEDQSGPSTPVGSPAPTSTIAALTASSAAMLTAGSTPSTPTRLSITSAKGKPPAGKKGAAVTEVDLQSPAPNRSSPLLSNAPAGNSESSKEYVSTANPARAAKSIWLLLRSYIRKLQLESGLNAVDETQLYYQHLEQYLRSEHTLQALLVLLPESKGGLLPIATGLFHKSPLVRLFAMRLLQRIQLYPSTRVAFTSLVGYFHTAYERQREKDADGTLQQEILDYNRAAKESRGVSLNEDVESSTEDAGEVFDGANALSSLLQNTFAMMGADEPYDGAFSETIDELDLIR